MLVNCSLDTDWMVIAPGYTLWDGETNLLTLFEISDGIPPSKRLFHSPTVKQSPSTVIVAHI